MFSLFSRPPISDTFNPNYFLMPSPQKKVAKKRPEKKITAKNTAAAKKTTAPKKNTATKKKSVTKKTATKKNRVTKKKALVKKRPSVSTPPAAPPAKPPRPVSKPGDRLTAATNSTAPAFVVRGASATALFTLTIYRGEGMCLLAMNWKTGTPPNNFVGFGIEYQEPGGAQFFPLSNRIAFPGASGAVNPAILSSKLSPIQKFRWVHFPFHAGIPGAFTYRVTPVFMDAAGALSYGDEQTAAIELEAETYPGKLNICFTRGFISSQAFIQHFGNNNSVAEILPATANAGFGFKPSYPNEEKALAWMGFEARAAILNVLDQAAADPTTKVRVAAYDFNDDEIVSRLQKLGGRLKIIIDDSSTHGPATSAESRNAALLKTSAGAANVQRQHMGQLQHNKMIVVQGQKVQFAIGGSCNFSWRGIYVQNNNTVVVQTAAAVQLFADAFDNLFKNPNNPTGFAQNASAAWNDLQLSGINGKVTFSPHNTSNAMLQSLANDILSTKSSLFYSLAFLSTTPGPIHKAIKKITDTNNIFVYGLANTAVGDLSIQSPDGNPPTAFPAALLKQAPPPFGNEVTGGKGINMHHKFLVIDFNKPTARVYTGSYNFSSSADTRNGENLFCFADQRIATSYMIEAVTMFDHYEYRDAATKAKAAGKPLQLQKPPAPGSADKPWWDEDWKVPEKARDRQLFGS